MRILINKKKKTCIEKGIAWDFEIISFISIISISEGWMFKFSSTVFVLLELLKPERKVK